jgi:ribosome-associated heat shock protein Hsp15
MNEVRIDKWMWATRIFKTRTIAAEACKKGRIMIGGVTIKPSRMIKVGDVIQVRKPPITFSFKVIGLIENRVGAKLVPNYLENVTTPDQYEILEMNRISGFVNRAKGLGRPTKKDRRAFKGGLTIDPVETGVHKNVNVFDYASLYPTTIMAYNISP